MTTESQPTRQEQIRRILDEVLVRRAQGEEVSEEAICAQHDNLLPELASELRKLAVIARARELLAHDTQPVDSAVVCETANYVPASLSRALHIRCPLCHEPFEIAVDQPLEALRCVSCNGRFSLAGDDPHLKAKSPVARIAHFELVERLGMGGFGTVWRAHDVELDRPVALKIPRRGGLDAAQVDEFLYEAKVAARLKHPNIVTVHDIGRDGENVYIISDLVEGVSLARFNEMQRLSHRQAVELLVTICDALHFAHQQGVVHRDLKPGNILIDPQGVPHITDFGLAKRVNDEMAITLEGEILGTPAYMSPEQARGETRQTDRRTDIYSLGVILFELLTDFLPFRGNVAMLTHHAIHTAPPSPRTLNASIPRDLETICLKCLEKDPNKRYATAKELADELRRFLRGDPILARPISAPERFWRWCLQNPRIPILSGALLAVVLVAYLFAWLSFERIYARTDRNLTDQALANVHFASLSIARTAGDELKQYYQRVDEAADDPTLKEVLREVRSHAELQQLIRELSDPKISEEAIAAKRRQFEQHPSRLSLQEWIEELAISDDMPIFAWFVTLPDGLQAARNPLGEGGNQTIGRNYSWRAYHHGGPHDHPDTWRAAPDQRVKTTQLSPVFVSRYTNEWVVVISTPILDGEEFLGVLGLMLRLGSFAELPHEVRTQVEATKAIDNRFAVLVDSRSPNPGQILQHPLYSALSSEAAEGETSPRRHLLDRSQEPAMRVELGDWVTNPHYRDPFGQASAAYDQRWLAAKLPVEVDGKPTGLYVIVQEGYDQIIGDRLEQMYRALATMSLLTLGLGGAVVISAWVIILRLVR